MKNKRKILTILLFLTIFLGLILRFYHLKQGLLFVYDQGRDALKIAEILRGKPTLIGPTTGLQGVFLGPFYYYFLAPWYWLGQGNPFYPSSFLLIFNFIVGGLVIYKFLKISDKKISAILVFYILAVSFYHLHFSKWLSNPSPLLVFAPLYFYLLYFWLKKRKYSFLTGLTLAICLQTEFAAAIFFIPTSLFLYLENIFTKKNKIEPFLIGKNIFGFIFGLSALILFNFRHGNIIFNSLKISFLDNSKNVTVFENLKFRPHFYLKSFSNYIMGSNQVLFTLLLIGILLWILKTKKLDQIKKILFAWLFIPLFLMLFYTGNEGNFWEYYLVGQYLAFLIILILFLSYLFQNKKTFFLILLFLFSLFNLKHYYFTAKVEANQISLQSYMRVIDRVYEKAEGEAFNVEVYVPNLLPRAYEYLFIWYGLKQYNYLPSDKKESKLFYILEPGNDYWRNDWLKTRKDSGNLVNTEKVGIIEIQELVAK